MSTLPNKEADDQRLLRRIVDAFSVLICLLENSHDLDDMRATNDQDWPAAISADQAFLLRHINTYREEILFWANAACRKEEKPTLIEVVQVVQ